MTPPSRCTSLNTFLSLCPQLLEEYPELELFFSSIGALFNVLYAIEAAIKIAAFSKAYFADPWNQFDFIMVLVSAGEFGLLVLYPGMRQFSFLRILRAMRALRLLRASRHSTAFRQMLVTLYYAVPQASAFVSLIHSLLTPHFTEL